MFLQRLELYCGIQDGGALECSSSRLFNVVLFFVYFLVCMFVLAELYQAKNVYSQHELIKYRLQSRAVVTPDFQRAHNIPADIARPYRSPWIVIRSIKRHRRCRERKQKQGCQAGLLTRLREQPHKPPLPYIFLSNARSIVQKNGLDGAAGCC